jgi:hypothetical protein
MRWVVVALVCLLALPLRAQERPDDVRAPLKVDIDRLVRTYLKAEARRNVGIALAGVGVALAILGGVVISYGAVDQYQLAAGYELAGGIISSGVGVALAIPGVVLWVTGQDDMDVATWRRKQLLTVSW